MSARGVVKIVMRSASNTHLTNDSPSPAHCVTIAAGDGPWRSRTGVRKTSPSGCRGAARARPPSTDAWRRETFTLPRAEARVKAREWFDRYPKAAYQTEIEFWRELEDDRIEFTMRRLPTAD